MIWGNEIEYGCGIDRFRLMLFYPQTAMQRALLQHSSLPPLPFQIVPRRLSVVLTLLLMAWIVLPAQAVITEVLQRGQTSETVKTLQQELIRQGYLERSLATGVFGELTELAVMRFQQENGLEQDGVAGVATLNALGLSTGRGGSLPQSLSLAEVKTLQAQLVALKFNPGPVDGVAGPQTEQALEAFQRRHQEDINPIVSATTLEQVSRVYERQLRLGSIRSVEDLDLVLPAASENGPITRVMIPRTQQENTWDNTSIPQLGNRFEPRPTLSRPTSQGRVIQPSARPVSRPAWDSSDRPFISAATNNTTPYIIAIPGDTWELLSEVQAYVPSAFQTENRRGPYIRAGEFSERATAEAEEQYLRSKGLDARVIFEQ